MSAVILPSKDGQKKEPTRPQTCGVAGMSFDVADGATRLAGLYNHEPLKVMFPKPTPGENICGVISSSAGGLLGGDRYDIEVTVDEGAEALVMPQAAEKVYRTPDAEAVVSVELNVKENGWLEWLPQETILFDEARLRRKTALDVLDGGKALAGEMMVFGRIASGEVFGEGLAREVWEIRRNGRIVWADALHLDKDIPTIMGHPAGFDGAVASATAVYVADDAYEYLDSAREFLGDDTEQVKTSATVLGDVLVMRWVGWDTLAMRNRFGAFWGAFRAKVKGLPEKLPRLWSV